MGTQRNAERTDLFLVRVWTQNSPDGSGISLCGGKVQWAVSGESHNFEDWKGLTELLLEMVATREKRRAEDAQAE
jgi:hypothetical protein